MQEQKVKRKKRSDRMHAIYRLVNTLTGEFYIGMTVCGGVSPKKAIEGRFQRHITRALTQDKDWTLCKAIREHGPTVFKVELVKTVRGKAEAHIEERLITKEQGATLNTA